MTLRPPDEHSPVHGDDALETDEDPPAPGDYVPAAGYDLSSFRRLFVVPCSMPPIYAHVGSPSRRG